MEKDKYNLKIIISIVLIVALLVIGFFVYKGLSKEDKKDNQKEENKEVITPLLYEVTKEGSNNKMYLFGSIHAANPLDLNFPDYVLNAYKNSHYLACEYNLVEASSDQEAILDQTMQLLYQDGTTIKDHLSTNTYNKLIDFLNKKEAYVNVYEQYKPFFFYSLISNLLIGDAKLSANAGIDMYFIRKAIEDKKTILEVESSEFQSNLLYSFPDTLYDLMLSEEIDDYDKSVTDLIDLYNSWKNGDINKLGVLVKEDLEVKDSYTKEQKEAIKDYNKKLIDDRNITMTDKAIEYFNSNKDVFFMVGTLHIIDDNGLVNNLKAKGFNVTQVK